MSGKLFAYGTLQVPEVQQDLVGRKFEMRPAELQGHACFTVRGQWYPAAIPQVGGLVHGQLLGDVALETLQRLDRYEGEQYRRVLLQVHCDGVQHEAWCYLLQPGLEHLLSSDSWDLQHFVREREHSWQP